jgi:hypothetical protein
MKRLLFIVCVLAGAGCQTTLRPTIDFEPSADFSTFQTFSWIDPNPLIRSATQRPLSPLVQTRLMESTRTALTGRGLRFVDDPAQADLAVAFTIGSREGIRITSYPTSSFQRGPAGRRDYRWRRGYWGTPQNNIRTRQYTEGQLAIDIFDVASEAPVWHGSVARRVTQREQGEPDAALQEAVVAIVAEFPPTN